MEIRALPVLPELTALLVQPALKRLFSTMPGVKVYTTGEAIPAVELKCALLSLPGIFKTSLEDVPAPLCYVHPPADCVAQWLRRPLPGAGNAARRAISASICCRGITSAGHRSIADSASPD